MAYNKAAMREFLQASILKARVLVLGDVMLDRYLYGDVTRISPEAPVPVNCIESQKDTLGGAANVAHNLARLGCQTFLAGLVGHDHYYRILQHRLEKLSLATDGLIEGRRKTTAKIRVIGDHQQMIRLDFEETTPIEKESEAALLQYVLAKLRAGLDCIIISDYKKGICTESLCQQVISLAHEVGSPVLVDPKGSDWQRYAGCDYITPNIKEVREAVNQRIKNDDEELHKAALFIKQKYGVKNVMATRSEKGLSLFLSDRDIHIPTLAQEVFDVSGAGDTVIAGFAAGLAAGLDLEDVAYLANMAAGIGVGKSGTYAVSREELLRVLN